jgi:hypothetical protein
MKTLGRSVRFICAAPRFPGRRFHDLASKLVAFQQRPGVGSSSTTVSTLERRVGAKGNRARIAFAAGSRSAGGGAGHSIGISIHSVEEAIAAEEDGATWCVAGTVFETPSHEGQKARRSNSSATSRAR